VVTSPVEHKAVLAAAHQAAIEGGEARLMAVDADGVVDLGSAEQALDAAAAVCSVMWVNNETGVVQPVAAVAERARARGVLVHADAVQALGRLPVDVRAVPVDLLTVSGHKVGAPKGIGALYVRRGTPLAPLLHGGEQDRGRRPGTENVAYAVALATAAELAAAEREREAARLAALRDALEAAVLAGVPDAVVHGRGAERAPHVTSVSVPGADGAALLLALDLHGVAASGGSACQTGKAEPSHVLLAMGVEPALAAAAVRFSVGALTTPACVARVGALVPRLAAKARALAAAGAGW
jgi:cysteine desulfurase